MNNNFLEWFYFKSKIVSKYLLQLCIFFFKYLVSKIDTFLKYLNRNEKTDVLPAYYFRLQSVFEYLSTYSEEVSNNENQKEHSKSLKEIQKLLENTEKTWEKGNKIEQKMVFIMDEDMLDFEIDRKLLSAGRYFDGQYIKLYKEKINNFKRGGKTKQKKSFLLGLIQDIQWQISKQKSMEPSVERLRRIMMGGMLLSIFCTVFAYRDVYTSSETYRLYFYLVISAGLMGTIFSMLIGVAKHSNELILDDLKNLLSIWLIGAKIALGIGAALLFFYFFQSKLFPLGVFPDINQLDNFLNWKESGGLIGCKDKCITNLGLEGLKPKEISEWDVNLYKLIIWSFLAGFSEQLVPDILNKTKAQINNST